MAKFHRGSWGGLPDFGITEAVQRRVAPARTSTNQGGSNLVGRAQPQPKPKATFSPRPTVQYSSPIGPTRPANILGTGGTGGSGSGGVGSGSGDVGSGGAPYEDQPDQPSIDFDALIAPALEGLEAAIGPLTQQFNDTKTSEESARIRNIDRTNTDITAQQGILNNAETKQNANAESAADAARRQFSEIQQGIQGMYGGSTGTGAFAAEIAGSQSLRNLGEIKQGLSQAVLEIDNKRQQIKDIGRIAIQDIEDQTRDRVKQAKTQLDLSLADIRRQKGELQSRKAELAMNAMQFYQQSVNAVNQRNAAFKQQLYVSQQAADQQLQQSIAKAKTAAQSVTDFDFGALSKTMSPLGLKPTEYSYKIPGGLGTAKFGIPEDEEDDLDPNAIPAGLEG